MCLSRVGSPQDDEVRVLYLAIGTCAAAHSKDRRQTDDARSMSSAVTAIDVVAAHDHTSEFLGHEIHFVGGLRTAEQPEALAAVGAAGLAKARGGAGERFVPASRAELAIVANKRRGESGTVGLHRGESELGTRIEVSAVPPAMDFSREIDKNGGAGIMPACC